MEIDRQLAKVYYNPKTGFASIEQLHRDTGVSRNKIRQWLSTQSTYTLHKPARKIYPRNKVNVQFIDQQWQMDLADLTNLKKHNDGYKYLLNCIDLFSKYAWSVPLKSKHAVATLDAFKIILKSGRQPQSLQTDAGTEFTNKDFQNFLNEKDIHFFTTKQDTKAQTIERFNRTLKTRMFRYFTKNNSFRYIDVLQDLVDAYNHSFHRTIGTEPANVNTNNEKQVREYAFTTPEKSKVKFKFQVGNKVRISKVKQHFEKGYTQNWSEEVFLISQCIARQPPVYKLKDLLDEQIEGVFYEPELQKVSIGEDELYIVEKILKKRVKNGVPEYFVKFRGYPDKFNAWVSDVEKV